MSPTDKQPTDSALFDSLAETFDLGPPVYEFGFCPVAPHGKSPAGRQTSSAINIDQSAGTDRLDDLAKLPFADASARTVICRGALEHAFEPRRAMAEMQRILKPGGVLFVSVPGNRSLSGGNHFWHFTPQALQQLMQPFEAAVLGWQGPDEQPHTVFAVACKGPVGAAFLRGLNLFPQRCQRRLDARATRIGWIRKLKQAMVAWAFSPSERRRFADHYRARFAIHMPVGKLSKRELLESCLGETKLGTCLDMEQ